MTEATEMSRFILRGLCYGSPRQESFETLDEALDAYAFTRYHSHENGITAW